MMHAYFYDDLLRGFGVVTGQILDFSIDLHRHRTLFSHYRASV